MIYITSAGTYFILRQQGNDLYYVCRNMIYITFAGAHLYYVCRDMIYITSVGTWFILRLSGHDLYDVCRDMIYITSAGTWFILRSLGHIYMTFAGTWFILRKQEHNLDYVRRDNNASAVWTLRHRPRVSPVKGRIVPIAARVYTSAICRTRFSAAKKTRPRRRPHV